MQHAPRAWRSRDARWHRQPANRTKRPRASSIVVIRWMARVILIPVLRVRRAGGAAYFSVTNPATEVGGPSHEAGDRKRGDKHDTHRPAWQLAASEREKRGHGHGAENAERDRGNARGLLVRLDRAFADAREILDELLGRLTGEKDGNGSAGHENGQHERQAAERRVAPEERDREEEQKPEGSKNGNVIEQEVQVGGVHEPSRCRSRWHASMQPHSKLGREAARRCRGAEDSLCG